jgi:hypothetical protein
VATASMDVQVAFSTSINENANSALSAWCESSQFIVQWQVQDAKGMTAEVIDATGRTVIDRSAKGSMGRVSIPATELPSGIYFLRVRANGTERTFKLPLMR